MTSENARIVECPMLSKLITGGGMSASTFRGYVGPSRAEGYVMLYPSLDNLSDSIEIARDDIIEFAEYSEPGQPAGQTIIWVKKDSQIRFHRVAEVRSPSDEPQTLDSSPAGRLQINVRSRMAEPVENCHSNCSSENCHSNCR